MYMWMCVCIWLDDASYQSRGESDASPFDTNLESQSSVPNTKKRDLDTYMYIYICTHISRESSLCSTSATN